MALANNQRHQMAKRLNADIPKLEATYTASLVDYNGDPEVIVKDSSAVVVARILLKQRSFSGFNVVAELSSSAAEGLPEHECWLDMKDSLTFDKIAKLVKACDQVGASSLKILSSAAPAEADLIDANVLAEIPNNARLGATGA